MLEDRTVPSAVNASGFVSGVVFLDSNQDGVLDNNESTLKGVSVTLSNESAQMTTLTDIDGRFSFRSVLPGDFTLTAGPYTPLANNNATVQRSLKLDAGEFLNHQDLGFLTGQLPGSAMSNLLGGSTLKDDLGLAPVGPLADRAPVVSHPLGTLSVPQNTTGKVIDLAGFFTDPDYTNSQVKFNLSVNGSPRSLTLNLFDAQAPQTVANFFDYRKAGDYNNTFFNRRTNPAPTSLGGDGIGVLQGGALQLNGVGTNFTLTPFNPPIPNEFGASNTADTIAMALTGSDTNSATDQFFFNTTDNSAQLDSQKFTVFGKLDAGSNSELAALATTPIHNLTNTILTHNFPNAGFAEVPLNDYAGSSATFPGDAGLNNYLVITGIDVLKRDESLTYKVISNNDIGLVTTSVNKEFLTLNAVAGKTGTATITVRATDQFGLSVDQTLTVMLTPAPAVTSVNITPDEASPVSSLKANLTSSLPPGVTGTVTFAYQWLQNGFPIDSTTVPSAATQTLQLGGLDVRVGDQFSVRVTPSITVGSVTTKGATFTSNPVTIATASPDPITLV
jgi:cyclophilin family peptidyl-prolyl cis-trans isomerase